MPVRFAIAQCCLAIALRLQESAVRLAVETERGHMDQSQSTRCAGLRQCGRRAMMYALIRFMSAFAQDADAVHDGGAVLERVVLGIGIEHAVEMDFMERNTGMGTTMLPSPRMAGANDDLASACEQGIDHMAADEAGAAEHQNDAWSFDFSRLAVESAHARLLF